MCKGCGGFASASLALWFFVGADLLLVQTFRTEGRVRAGHAWYGLFSSPQ